MFILKIAERGYDYIGAILEDAPETLILRPDPTVVDCNVKGGNLPTEVSVEIVPNTSHAIFRDNQSDFLRLLDGFASRHI